MQPMRNATKIESEKAKSNWKHLKRIIWGLLDPSYLLSHKRT